MEVIFIVSMQNSLNKSLIIKDRIYGSFKITSPIIIELINSHPLQRLKKIAQYGVPDELYFIKNYSRFEHSVGVMYLLKILGASEKEQIAGLIHDTSHYAFSHVIDFLFKTNKTQNYQDSIHAKYVLSSKIPEILQNYGYNPQELVKYHNFQLLEREVPEMCADRIDYALREFSRKEINRCIKALLIKDNKIIFKSRNTACFFAKKYLSKFVNNWGSPESVIRYALFANVLQIAINNNVIKVKDLLKDDDYVYKIIKNNHNKKIKKIVNFLKKNKHISNLPLSKEIIYTKFRFVDPQYLDGNKLIYLSKVDRDFEKMVKEIKNINSNGFYLPIID